MKVPNISINSQSRYLKTIVKSGLIVAPLIFFPVSKAQDKPDVIKITETATIKGTPVSPAMFVPNPTIKIGGEDKNAVIVVIVSKNTLYTYNEDGSPKKAYVIATGKPSTPTSTGIRKITDIETYPYKTAYGTKRRRNPKDYGPKAIILSNIDEKTGDVTYSDGIFIHGNNNPSSIGKKVSHGCMRMDNEVIQEVAAEVKPGQFVKIIK